MLARLYKSAVLWQNLILIGVILLLWLPRFYAFPAMPPPDYQQPFFDFCFGWLRQSSYLGMGIALMMMLVAAFVEQRSLNFDRLRLSGHNFPALMFVVLSATPHVVFFSPITFVVVILTVALLFLFRIPEMAQNDHLIFLATFFFGIATLFYLPTLFLLGTVIAMCFWEKIPFKKIWVAILGFHFPVIWVVAGLYLSSNLKLLTEQWSGNLFVFSFPLPASDMLSFVVMALLILIYLAVIIRIISKYSERTAIIRRRILISIYFILWLLASAFFSYNFYEHLSLLSIPMVALISYYYNEDGQSSWVDYVLFGGFVALVVYSFLQLWH